jgi:hypothetical protein
MKKKAILCSRDYQEFKNFVACGLARLASWLFGWLVAQEDLRARGELFRGSVRAACRVEDVGRGQNAKPRRRHSVCLHALHSRAKRSRPTVWNQSCASRRQGLPAALLSAPSLQSSLACTAAVGLAAERRRPSWSIRDVNFRGAADRRRSCIREISADCRSNLTS